MKFNHAVYANHVARANERDARHIELDRDGNPVNLDRNGQPFHYEVIRAAQDRQSFNVYRDAMSFLDSIIGDDADTKTRKAFSQATGKFLSVGHAEEMRERLIVAALNDSQAALIAYAAACIFINPYAPVDFGWFTNGSDELTAPITAEDGYPVQTGPATITVSATVPAGDFSDYEGFATTYHVATPTITAPTTSQPITLVDNEGRTLTATATGWQAESKSQPGTFHTTSASGSSCSCKGHTYRAKCWHTALVRAHVAGQQRQERENALPAPRRPIKTRDGIRSRMWK